MVYVQNIEGNPLMPTTRYCKVRKMLKGGLARVVQRMPFTIRLNYKTTEFKQPISLGIDAGSVYIGVSATTEDKELYAAEVHLRTDIVGLLATRRELRHTRRIRKIRHRKIKLNRSRKTNKLLPSTEHKVCSHIRIINEVYKILPISFTTIEAAQFDIQKINDPEISGVEYQKGEQYGFWNVREFVLCRDEHTCQYCKGKSGDRVLNVHHIESRKTGGDSPNNLITLCKACHSKIHKGLISLDKERGIRLHNTVAMGIIRKYVFKRAKSLYGNVRMSYGYKTKCDRIANNLKKSHSTDAFCISGNLKAKPLNFFYAIKQVRRHNRQTHKSNYSKGGYRKSNQAPFKVRGFQLFDKVLYREDTYFVFGRRQRGGFSLKNINGEKIFSDAYPSQLKLIQHSKRLLIEQIKRY